MTYEEASFCLGCFFGMYSVGFFLGFVMRTVKTFGEKI